MKFACLLLGLAAALPSRAEMDRAALVRLAGTVLKVEVLRQQGGYALGSGVVVDGDKVITNCHVTRDSRQLYVLRGDARWAVEAQLADPAHDLCLLRVPALASPVAALGQSAGLRLRQPVMALGYSGGIELQISAGEIVAMHRYDGSAVIQSSNFFTSGASGGGLFDEAGRLVGILTFRMRGAKAHYFAAPVDWVRRLLDSREGGSPVAPLDSAALAYWQRAPEAQPEFLRVAVLEHERRWAELEALGSRWSELDADDAEAWYTRGFALAQLEQWSAARVSLEKAVELEPGSGLAWFRLGVVCATIRQLDRAREALAMLRSLDAPLAAELGQLIDKETA